MLLTSTGVISRSQQEESVLLLRKIEELNKNTARLIVEAGKLIQESKQLSDVRLVAMVVRAGRHIRHVSLTAKKFCLRS